MGFFDGNSIFMGPAPVRPTSGQDLGEYGAAGRSGSGYTPGSIAITQPSEFVTGSYWGRSLGVISPAIIGNDVAIGQYNSSYGAKLSVNGNIFALGYLLSDGVFIIKDVSDNLVFTDPVSGSKTLAQLIASAGGDVIITGTPVAGELAEWVDASHIQGKAISSLTLTQSQITGLVSALTNKASKVHNLVDTVNHPVTGLTIGHFLKALSPTSYGFVAHGLTKIDIGLPNVTNDAQVKKATSSTNLAIARWNGTTGDSLKDSLAQVGDDGSINIPTGATYKINGVSVVLGGGGGAPIVPVSALLFWDAANSWYTAYATQHDGKFDVSATYPAHTTKLNYDGAFYARSLGAAHLTIDTIGLGVTYANLISDVLTFVVDSVERCRLEPTVSTGATAVAYMLDTYNLLATSGAKLLSLRNQGTEKLFVDKDGYIGTPVGSLRHLQISAGAASGSAGTDAGHLILKAGNAIGSDATSIEGSLYLVPGNPYVAGYPSHIYLGDTGFNGGTILFDAVGSETNIGVVISSKGAGNVELVATSGQIVAQGNLGVTGNIYPSLDLMFMGFRHSVVTGTNGAAGYENAYDLIIKGGTGASGGSAQNLVLYSEQLDNAAWTKVNNTVVANQAIDMLGNTTLEKVTDNSNYGYLLQASIPVTASTTYTISFDVKNGTVDDGCTINLLNQSSGDATIEDVEYLADITTSLSRYSHNFSTPSGCTLLKIRLVGGQSGQYYHVGRIQIALNTTPAKDYIVTTSSAIISSGGTGGNLKLWAGMGSGAANGKIYIGTGSAGTNPLAGSGTGTSILLYNRATGEITFGDK